MKPTDYLSQISIDRKSLESFYSLYPHLRPDDDD